jgi:hypothetical protein
LQFAATLKQNNAEKIKQEPPMKINVEFDLTPDEFRHSLGLPDVEAFQKNLLENIQRQMESGVEGYDPMSLMRPFSQQPMTQQGLSQGLSQGLANFGTYQQMMLDMLRQAGSSASADSDKEASQRTSNQGTSDKGASNKGGADQGKSNKESSSEKSTNATASSRSRAKG